ncbi:hypothetical protein GGX14DRAFT_471193 [Mycena pura]|uniref:F-box domain-containing protein n=1 Tax=Mycena pura TaxID=153505 RepID=A0AAD6Y3H5_9AGAR|nr:hypothetical protein GGX14DRAFT_471193 [Mycena pura]
MATTCDKCGHRTDTTGHSTADQRTALAQIDAEILRFRTYAEGHVAGLKEQRRAISARLETVVYPVLTLPNEITIRIFTECLPHHGRVRPSPHSPPLLLTQICRHWRNTALSIGELWTSFDTATDMLGPGRSDLLRWWLSLTKGYPLSWTIHAMGMTPMGNVGTSASHITDIIQPTTYLPKLRCLEVNASENRFRDLVPLRTPLPLLRCLAATLGSENLRDILQCAPDLRHLTTRSLSPDLYLASKSLVSLELTGYVNYPADVFLAILNNYPLLSHLKCGGRVTHARGAAVTPATFPSLRSLQFSGLGVLEFLTLPNLTHLEFSQPLRLDIIQPFLSRSGCVIKHLCCVIRSEWGAFKASLEIFPWVETLEIVLDDEGRTHLFGLALHCLDLSEMSLVPLLRNVVINHATLYFDFSRIVDVLKRRRELRSFHLIVHVQGLHRDYVLYWRLGCTAAADLAHLRSCGVDFSIRGRTDYREFGIWPPSPEGMGFPSYSWIR